MDLEDQVELPRYGAEDREARKERGRDDRVAADADVEGAVAGFVEAVLRVAVGGEDCDFVAKILQAYGCVYYEAFCAADPKVGVEEDYVLGFGFGGHCGGLLNCLRQSLGQISRVTLVSCSLAWLM